MLLQQTQHSGRRLTWLYHLSNGEVKARLNKRVFELQATTFQVKSAWQNCFCPVAWLLKTGGINGLRFVLLKIPVLLTALILCPSFFMNTKDCGAAALQQRG